jgi:hypothetical protein
MAVVDVRDLTSLDSIDKLSELFRELNYEYVNSQLSTRHWKQETARLIYENDVRLLARHKDFHIVYCRIDPWRLATERPIVNQLLKENPYLLVVFSDKSQRNWHFVNIKYDEEIKNRRLFRRIVIGQDERLHTAAERINLLEVLNEETPTLELQTKHDEAFDVEKVTKIFHEDYEQLFNSVVNAIRGRESYSHAHKFTHLLFNRIMFLYFIQRKGWLKGINGKTDKDFVHNLWEHYRTNYSKRPNTFYDDCLKPLFFDAMKNPRKHGFKYSRRLPPELLNVYLDMPHLNGGLFQEDEDVDDIDFQVPDDVFQELVGRNGLLQHYNFTVREDLPLDYEVALDHDMLGSVYESAVNEDERGEAGMFYTHRTEVDLMCRSSVMQFLDGFNILPQDELIRFVFNADYPEEIPAVRTEQLHQIRDKIREAKVVDPACGSGAFLVGMLKVLTGMLRTIHKKLGEPLDMFKERRRMIGQNLYGVDVKSWAVKICELRLWLTLVVEADDSKIDLHNGPLLPNLDYNIRQGDSLVEEIVKGKQLVLRNQYAEPNISSRTKRLITEIQGLKADFFEGKTGSSKRDIETKKRDFIKSFLKEEQEQLQKQMTRVRRGEEEQMKQSQWEFARTSEQTKLTLRRAQDERRRIEEKIAELERRFDDCKLVLNELSNTGERGYFLWDLDFAEVFYNRHGFDIVIGNPPYVRQEAIAPPTKNEEDYDPDKWRELKREYKEELIESVQLHWKDFNPNRKADLYVYFYLHGLALLRPGGSFCFITSNSWLDVGYGAVLQEFLLKHIEVAAIFDNQVKRSFASADVNTVISLFRRPENRNQWLKIRDQHLSRFVAFKKPFEICITAENLVKIFKATEVTKEEHFRLYPVPYNQLFEEGKEEKEEETTIITGGMQGKYTGGKWGGKYLRAPDIFFAILEKGKGKFVELRKFGNLKRGVTTGINEFFYLSDKQTKEWKIEKEFLKLAIVSPRDCESIHINRNQVKRHVFLCHKDKKELKGTNALRYIELGESRKFHKKPSFSNNKKWYSLRENPLSDIILYKHIGDKEYPLKNDSCFVNNVLYEVGLFDKKDLNGLLSFLSSSFIFLFEELQGQVGLGEGALVLKVPDWEKCPVFKINFKDERFFRREIKPIFEELGIDPSKPIREQEPKPLPDRAELDKIVFDEIGLTEQERKEVYWAMCELVKKRLEKAKSV